MNDMVLDKDLTPGQYLEFSRSILIDPYGAIVQVVLSTNPSETVRSKDIVKRFGMTAEDFAVTDQALGVTFQHGSNFLIVFNSTKLTWDTLAHECFHMAIYVAQAYLRELDWSRHEAVAYINGFLVEKVVGICNEAKLKPRMTKRL